MPTINESVATGADDGMLARFGTYLLPLYASTSLLNSHFSVNSEWWIALRFQTIDIPQGATIDSATLTLKRISTSGSPTINIYGSDVDNAPAWGSGNRVKDITKTAAFTVLDTANATSANDVTAIIQELVDRPGWASGNDISFGFFQPSTGGNWKGYSFEKGGADIPTLDITYTAGGGVTAVPVFYHHLQQQGIA
jgi:hypothetical protein